MIARLATHSNKLTGLAAGISAIIVSMGVILPRERLDDIHKDVQILRVADSLTTEHIKRIDRELEMLEALVHLQCARNHDETTKLVLKCDQRYPPVYP